VDIKDFIRFPEIELRTRVAERSVPKDFGTDLFYNPITMPIPQTIIRFPEIELRTRDAHKLRGYFGNLFREKSELLHNHLEGGEFKYDYPKVQYKVIQSTPTLVGIADGAGLLTELFLKIRELNIDGKIYPVHQKNIEAQQVDPGATVAPNTYRFETLWMGLNQKNHTKYSEANALEREKLLERILVGNCLSFFKSLDIFVDTKLEARGSFNEKSTRFKNNRMIAFDGMFEMNADLPDFIGLGKQVSRGFGTIQQMK